MNFINLYSLTNNLTELARMVARRFPNPSVYPALGNNDSYCGDYQIEPSGRFLRATAKIWKGFLKNKSNSASFVRIHTRLSRPAIDLIAHRAEQHLLLDQLQERVRRSDV
jgi:hypothetical protein